MNPTLTALHEQINRAEESSSLGVVTHLSGGMAHLILQMTLKEEVSSSDIMAMKSSWIVHHNDEREWCVTLAR